MTADVDWAVFVKTLRPDQIIKHEYALTRFRDGKLHCKLCDSWVTGSAERHLSAHQRELNAWLKRKEKISKEEQQRKKQEAREERRMQERALGIPKKEKSSKRGVRKVDADQTKLVVPGWVYNMVLDPGRTNFQTNNPDIAEPNIKVMGGGKSKSVTYKFSDPEQRTRVLTHIRTFAENLAIASEGEPRRIARGIVQWADERL